MTAVSWLCFKAHHFIFDSTKFVHEKINPFSSSDSRPCVKLATVSAFMSSLLPAETSAVVRLSGSSSVRKIPITVRLYSGAVLPEAMYCEGLLTDGAWRVRFEQRLRRQSRTRHLLDRYGNSVLDTPNRLVIGTTLTWPTHRLMGRIPVAIFNSGCSPGLCNKTVHGHVLSIFAFLIVERLLQFGEALRSVGSRYSMGLKFVCLNEGRR